MSVSYIVLVERASHCLPQTLTHPSRLGYSQGSSRRYSADIGACFVWHNTVKKSCQPCNIGGQSCTCDELSRGAFALNH